MLVTLCWSAGALGLLVLLVQRLALAVALNRPRRTTNARPGISILKPLCGVDDALEANLESFRHLDWPSYEVLLGVKDRSDPAWALACSFAARDARFRVVQQTSSPGLNPKVNQLISLAKEAQFELILVSDSNARLPADALEEIAAHFDDAKVACVTNPVSGSGHESFGALLDNLHLVSAIGAAQLGAKTLANKDLVVGKSMALRRRALDSLGGFEAYGDVLAEDYVIGQDLRRRGLEIRVATSPVWNVATRKPVRAFFERYLRWGIIHRTAVSLPTSLAQGLLNPFPFFVIALIAEPSKETGLATFIALLIKSVLDVSSARALRCTKTGWRTIPAVAVKDLLVFVTWFHGLFARTVLWRGNRLKVGRRSRLLRPTPALEAAEPTS